MGHAWWVSYQLCAAPAHGGLWFATQRRTSPAYRLHINTRTSQSAVHVQVHPYAVTSFLSLTFHFPFFLFFSERAVFLLHRLLLQDKEDIPHTWKDKTKKTTVFFSLWNRQVINKRLKNIEWECGRSYQDGVAAGLSPDWAVQSIECGLVLTHYWQEDMFVLAPFQKRGRNHRNQSCCRQEVSHCSHWINQRSYWADASINVLYKLHYLEHF